MPKAIARDAAAELRLAAFATRLENNEDVDVYIATALIPQDRRVEAVTNLRARASEGSKIRCRNVDGRSVELFIGESS